MAIITRKTIEKKIEELKDERLRTEDFIYKEELDRQIYLLLDQLNYVDYECFNSETIGGNTYDY